MNDEKILAAIAAAREQATIDYEARVARLDNHWEYFLEYLRDKFGFNLDVATDVYPRDKMLDPEGQYDERHLLRKLHKLLESIDRNPHKPLLIVRTWREQVHRGTGDTSESQFKTKVAIALLADVSLENIIYQATDGSSEPYIAINGDDVVTHIPLSPHYEVGTLVNIPQGTTNGVVIGIKGSESGAQSQSALFDLSSEEVRLLHDPDFPTAIDAIEKAGMTALYKIECVLSPETVFEG